MAVRRDVLARWVPALTPDIVAQKVVWTINGKQAKKMYIGARVRERSWLKDVPNIFVREGDTIKCEVCAVDDAGNCSSVIQADVTFTESAPDAPKNLNLTPEFKYRNIP